MSGKKKHLDLFSGIMGFSLGLERTGKYRSVGFCDIEPYAQALICEKKPNQPLWPDIVKLNECLELASILSPAGSRAKTSALQAKALGYSMTAPPDKPEPARDSLGRLYVPFAWLDREASCWRTWQHCFIEEWAKFSASWPPAGTTLNGIAYRREGLAGGICDGESICFPTLTATDHKGSSSNCKKTMRGELSLLRHFLHFHYGNSTQTSYPHPEFAEAVMGYKTGWTELKDAGMRSTLKSLKSWAKRSGRTFLKQEGAKSNG